MKLIEKKTFLAIFLTIFIGGIIFTASFYFFKYFLFTVDKERLSSPIEKSSYGLDKEKDPAVQPELPDISELPDLSKEAIKVKCLEETDKMSDEQIIDKIKSMFYAPDKKRGETEVGMEDYLLCIYKNDISEFAQTTHSVSYYKTLASLRRLSGDKTWERLEPTDSLSPEKKVINIFALEPTELICLGDEEKTELLELCLKNLENLESNLSPEEIKEEKSNCSNICEIINKYTNNIPFWEADLLNNTTWSDNEHLLDQQMRSRTAMGFRFGGKELALKVCDNVPNLEMKDKEYCQKYVDSLDRIKNCKRFGYGGAEDCIVEECANYRQKVINLICEDALD
jgi:hypothetical protein